VGKEAQISTDGSNLKAFVIPTDEELLIARDTVRCIAGEPHPRKPLRRGKLKKPSKKDGWPEVLGVLAEDAEQQPTHPSQTARAESATFHGWRTLPAW